MRGLVLLVAFALGGCAPDLYGDRAVEAFAEAADVLPTEVVCRLETAREDRRVYFCETVRDSVARLPSSPLVVKTGAWGRVRMRIRP